MQVTAIEGVVENGRIRLREDVVLAENTRVFVVIADAPVTSPPRIRTPHLADPKQAVDFQKQIVEIRPDAKL